ncbi:MAG: hypothetical protein HYW47_00710 [Deltaproteobacteria bacterium]|nr:hypothetical protein [Deltaproteobacteria bacterium]
MFKEFLKLWSQEKTLLEEMNDMFDEMLEKSEKNFHDVTEALFLGGNLPQLKVQVRAEDHEINKLEQAIRRKIVTHLSVGISSLANINTGLILMSVVKDVERIGDYAKNIFEVFEKTSILQEDAYHDRLLEIRNTILETFKDVKFSYKESNEARARTAISVVSQYKDKCDAIVEELLDNPVQFAVAYALLARFFKRTLGHLGNIATSVVMPLDKLDYLDEKSLA